MSKYDRQFSKLPRKPPFQQLVAPTIHRMLEGKPSKVLEAGCGTCHVTEVLTSLEGFEITCCDIAEPASVPEGATFHVQDLSKPLPFEDGSFDGVVCTEVIEHLKAPFHALEEFIRVLRPDGYLAFTIPNHWSARKRLRYLLTGNLDQTHYFNPRARVFFRENSCPHINTTTLPIYEYGLASMGIELEGFRLGGRRSWSGMLLWPLALLIRLTQLFRKPRRKKRFMLAHTNHLRVLMGGDHIMLVGRKVGFDQVTYEVAPLRDLDRS